MPMSAGPNETQEVPVDVLPPIPKDAPLPPPPPVNDSSVPFAGLRTFYHPASGVVILGLDWLAFGTAFSRAFSLYLKSAFYPSS